MLLQLPDAATEAPHSNGLVRVDGIDDVPPGPRAVQERRATSRTCTPRPRLGQRDGSAAPTRRLETPDQPQPSTRRDDIPRGRRASHSRSPCPRRSGFSRCSAGTSQPSRGGAAARRDQRCGKRGHERYQVNRLNVLAVGQSAGNVARRSPASLSGEHQDRARAQRAHRSPIASAAMAQDHELMPSCDNGRPLTGAAPQARHGVPLQQHNLQGAALLPTCRLDGVGVGRSLRLTPSEHRATQRR